MSSLPSPLGAGDLMVWRLDDSRYAATWDSGEGAFQVGGRWNSRGVRAVYAALDPSTAILEVAVHKGFPVLDTVPHILSAATVIDPTDCHVVQAADVPNANWLRPGLPSAGQQAFGDGLLKTQRFILIPSVVSPFSWNAVFDPAQVKARYRPAIQTAFALDPRLHPPKR